MKTCFSSKGESLFKLSCIQSYISNHVDSSSLEDSKGFFFYFAPMKKSTLISKKKVTQVQKNIQMDTKIGLVKFKEEWGSGKKLNHEIICAGWDVVAVQSGGSKSTVNFG